MCGADFSTKTEAGGTAVRSFFLLEQFPPRIESGNVERFSRRSATLWLPAVIDVEPEDNLRGLHRRRALG